MSTAAVGRSPTRRAGWRASWRAVELALAAASLALLWTLWLATVRPVAVTVDGMQESVRTHRRTVGALLLDLGLDLQSSDRVAPPLETRLTPGLQVTVARARPFRVLADGRDIRLGSWGQTAHDVLADAGVAVDRYDRVIVAGQPVAHDHPLSPPVVAAVKPTYNRGYGWDLLQRPPLQLQLVRAVPITVDDGELPFTIRTTAQTVGEALREAEITLYLGDRVQPHLGSSVSAGLRVFIERSTPVSLEVDGRRIKTRTQADTVADALAELGLPVAGMDRIEPPLESDLYDDAKIRITRVWEEVEIKEEIAPFETLFKPDASLPIDTQQLVSPGAEGVTRTRYRVRYEDGQETARTLEDTWVAQEPAQRVIAYGQQIAPNTITAGDGTQITYWRMIRMYASSYSADTAGVSPDKPWYGRTYTGDRMRRGIVAVDPSIVPLRSKVYVAGYGVGDALDTGSAVRARTIDLGYDDGGVQYWNKWVDVYLLWPPPPAYQITWVLPNWPRPPQ